MENPISIKGRAKIYIGGIIFTGLATVAMTVLTVLGLDVYLPIITSLSLAVTGIVGILARANLSLDDTQPTGRHRATD